MRSGHGNFSPCDHRTTVQINHRWVVSISQHAVAPNPLTYRNMTLPESLGAWMISSFRSHNGNLRKVCYHLFRINLKDEGKWDLDLINDLRSMYKDKTKVPVGTSDLSVTSA